MEQSHNAWHRRYYLAGKATIELLMARDESYLTVGIPVSAVNNLDTVIPRAIAKRAAIKEALCLLAGQASVEFSQSRVIPDDSARPVRRARAILTEHVLEPASVTDLLRQLRLYAEIVVGNCWPAIDRVAGTVAARPELTADELAHLIDEAIDQVDLAYAYSFAATAVCTELLGGEVTRVTRDHQGDLMQHVLFGDCDVELPVSPALRMAQQERYACAVHPQFQMRHWSLIQRIRRVARRVDFGQAALEELAAAWGRHEQALDRAAGPLHETLHPEFLTLCEIAAVQGWAGEIAAHRATGMHLPNCAGQAMTLQHFATLGLPPAEAVRQLTEAKVLASAIVDQYWPAIDAVTDSLMRQTTLSGEEIRALIARATPPSDDLVA